MIETLRQPPVALTPAERSALHERTNGYQLGYDAGYGRGVLRGRIQGFLLGAAAAGAAALAHYWL